MFSLKIREYTEDEISVTEGSQEELGERNGVLYSSGHHIDSPSVSSLASTSWGDVCQQQPAWVGFFPSPVMSGGAVHRSWLTAHTYYVACFAYMQVNSY